MPVYFPLIAEALH